MKIAACSSITSARRARETSMPINSRSTAAVDSRSSQSAMARPVRLEKLRAKARVDCARGPSLPSMLMGRPSTKPTTLRSLDIASSRAASALNALRWIVSTPVASRRSGSDTATPMVLVPRSRPIRAPRSGQWVTASIRGRMGAGMAPHNTQRAAQAKPMMAWRPCGNATPSVVIVLSDRDRVDHALHAAPEARLAEHEQELIGLVLGEFGGIHVFQNVSPVHRQQDLVHLEHIFGYERDHFDRPGVGTDRHHALAGEVLRAFDAEPGLAGGVTLVVLADQAEPAGMEDHDIALADLDALLLRDLFDLLDVERGALLDHVGVVIGGHVEQHATGDHGGYLLDTELLQAVGIGEVGQLVAVVIDVVDADMAEAVELATDADPGVEDVVIIGRLARPESGDAGLSGLHDGDLEGARRIGGCLAIDGNAERVSLAGLDQRSRLQDEL